MTCLPDMMWRCVSMNSTVIFRHREVTAGFAYVRLHGPGGAYRGSYDTQTLAGWAGAFSTWTAQDRDVYCYFDNDEAGYAAQNAKALQDMLCKA